MTTERTFHSSKVMVWWLLLLPLSVATLCRPGYQFWDETSEKCVNCSKCPIAGHVVIRPCQVHQDTQCGPLSALDIDWSFISRPRSTNATGSSRRQRLSAKHNSGTTHREVFLEGHFLTNKDSAGSSVTEHVRTSRNHPQSEWEKTQSVKHRNKHLHPKFVSSEGLDAISHNKSHHIEFFSEESSSGNVDETPKHYHKHHRYHKKHATSETRSSNPRKLQNQNRNKTKNRHHHNHHHHHHRQKSEWTSSDTVRSFDSPDFFSSSELHLVGGHKWSSSETASSTEHHTSSFRKSNNTLKHANHHSHHSHSHTKQMNTPETHKNHDREQKLQSLQEEVDRMLVHRPESASQLKESETVVNSSLDSDVKVLGVQAVFPKHVHKVNSPASVSSAPFSATEELIWDWQAVALALAVFACLLFFIVACAYSVHHARQWRRLKDHFEDFEADVGELSTRLSLLLPTVRPEEGAVQTECCNNSSQCVYLEQLLARKQQAEEEGEHGNVYIDREVVTGHRD